MKVSCIIVTYNGMRWVDRCMGGLLASSVPLSVIVVDNASTDGTAAYIKKQIPQVDLLESKENLGFAKANNIGIRQAFDAGADYFLLLNQDAWVQPDTVAELLKTFEENEKVGIASPIHLNGSRSALDHHFVEYMGGNFASDAYLNTIKHYYELTFVNAAAWLIGRECVENVGGFDTLLFRHYGEDVNYCQRVAYHGFKIFVNTQCSICHDREDRKVNDEKYQSLANQTEFMEERIKYGDINIAYDIDAIKRGLKRKMVLKRITGKYDAARFCKREWDCFDLIETSRKTNSNKGLNWL